MGYTLGEASEATKKSKTAIRNAIKKGRISAVKDDAGQYDIDPAELHRVYPMVHSRPVNVHHEPEPEVHSVSGREIELLREMLADRERTIEDLRRRLDDEGEERRKAQAQVTALLTDQRPSTSPQEPAGGRVSRAWRILRGKG